VTHRNCKACSSLCCNHVACDICALYNKQVFSLRLYMDKQTQGLAQWSQQHQSIPDP